uniref:Di-and tricarboxylate transporter/sulfate-sodium-transporter n=1 Tax=uncultured sulfate-reducing bacterium TaxID=153939 RepID=Q3IBN6_9BACT|nr:Di-and tricarboxylate transporter/sulfate-sodium-transporter [uncultured sulfate-reducing bacterium]
MTSDGETELKTHSQGSLPKAPEEVYLATVTRRINWRRIAFILLGLFLFVTVAVSPPWPDAVDPSGESFALDREGKLALGLFLLAAVWWVFEVVPIGITSIAIGVVQALFLIRPARVAFTDFMDPSVWFIIGSIVIGMVFTKTGLTKRMAYKMLVLVGERTSMIYLGVFVLTALLAHIMAHTAVAATIYPLLMAIYTLYEEDNRQTKFGAGLFMGMAYTAGAGSIITLLGAARGAVALGFYKDVVGREISFFELTYYMFPIGWLMVFVLWGFFMIFCKPEQKRIVGLRERASNLYAKLGPMSKQEIIALTIVLATVVLMSLRSFIPALAGVNKSAIILASTVVFFLFRILEIEDLEDIPWNIILLFGGAMSIGFCLWQTGAAKWLAVQWLVLFEDAPWFVFVMGITFFVLLMTNFIMNVAAIAISLPVALVLAGYLGVAPEVVLFASLVAAGMPFLLLVGAAPNAIAYGSGQFTSGQFFLYGIPASIILMIVIGIFVRFVWPLMDMPILLD